MNLTDCMTFIYDPNNWEDPEMQELHWLRAERSKEFNYDVDALLKDSAACGKAVREEWERRKKEREADNNEITVKISKGKNNADH